MRIKCTQMLLSQAFLPIRAILKTGLKYSIQLQLAHFCEIILREKNLPFQAGNIGVVMIFRRAGVQESDSAS